MVYVISTNKAEGHVGFPFIEKDDSNRRQLAFGNHGFTSFVVADDLDSVAWILFNGIRNRKGNNASAEIRDAALRNDYAEFVSLVAQEVRAYPEN